MLNTCFVPYPVIMSSASSLHLSLGSANLRSTGLIISSLVMREDGDREKGGGDEEEDDLGTRASEHEEDEEEGNSSLNRVESACMRVEGVRAVRETIAR